MTLISFLRATACFSFALAVSATHSAWALAAATNANVSPAPSSAAALTAAPPASVVQPVTLATLGNLSGPIRLVGETGLRSMSVPISAREKVNSAVLHLVVTNSVSLLSDRSELAVRVNDRTIAQMQLSSRQPELTADVRVPADLLRPGYNTLTFAAAQHSTENCEDPNSPELWSEIDTNASTLQLQTELKPLAPQLSDLPDLIDPKQQHGGALTIVAAQHPANDTALGTGALLAQGAALRLRYLSPTLRVLDAQAGKGGGVLPGLSLAKLADTDVLLFGTRDALRPYLAADVSARIKGAFLGIYPKPDDPRRFVLVVSGVNDAQVQLAARSFAHPEFAQPHLAEMVINALDEARISRYSARRTLVGTQPHSFRSLGFTSRTLGASDRVDLDVMLPADIYAPEDAQVTLDLNFTEGAKMRQDSVLNVYLNDRFEQVIALDQQQGALLRHYRVNIPLRSFRPGANVLSLRPVLVPLLTEHCMLRETRNLLLTVFDDSSITLPPAAHFTTMPDLRRFAQSGFPYTVSPDGSGLAVHLGASDNSTIASAWSLMGKLAQSQRWPLTAAQVTTGTPEAGRQTIVIGSVGALSQWAWQGAPWQPGHVMTLAYRADETDNAAPHARENIGTLGRLMRAGFGAQPSDADAPPSTSVLDADAPLSEQLLVMQYKGSSGNTVTAFTAANPDQLVDGVRRMIEPNYWDNLGGDVSELSFDSPELWTGRSGARYDVGSLNAYDRMGFEVSRHPWWGYAGVLALLALLSVLTVILLRRRHRKHHGGSQG
ncbi:MULTISPECIES: cellulose biosynthesis cyclic di-GMP-binding regulatory protein BcsB [unclassified Paraburkholderia]|uniref:cellulose biosynthesis cyclic di-GMP-binding regulatory protein BcsB n=1 Tax=unclassified Paraburkholderia TaxID=2615204 RepID=UPI002AB2BCB2|nr:MULTISPECIES: cellulose biosynthesis cyclic di-GMP-binding regulatory protein BcsB [unclassified Paraburkholderia]